jgi:hypothetical protein
VVLERANQQSGGQLKLGSIFIIMEKMHSFSWTGHHLASVWMNASLLKSVFEKGKVS